MTSAAGQTPKPERPHRRVSRAILYGLLAIWLVGVVAALLLALALARGWQLDRMRPVLELAAGEILDRDLQIGSLEGSLLEGLTLRDVSLGPIDARPDGGERLVVGEVEVRVDVWASLRGRGLWVDELTLSGAQFSLWRNLEAGWQVTGWGELGGRGEGADSASPPTPHTPATLPLDLQLQRLTLRDITFELLRDERSGLADGRARLDASLEGIRWAAGRELAWPRTGEVRLGVDQIAWRDLDLGRGDLECQLRGSRIAVRSLNASGAIGQVSGGGDLTLSGLPLRPRLVGGRLRFDFERVAWGALRAPASPPGPPQSGLAGQLVATLVSHRGSPPNAPTLQVRVDLEPSQLGAAALRGGELRGELQTADWAWRVDPSFIELDAGRVGIAGAGRSGRARQIEVSAENLELRALPAAWRPFSHTSGVLSLKLELAGPLRDPVGRLRVGATSLRAGQLGPGEFSAELAAEGGRRYRLELLELSLPVAAGRSQGAWLRSRRPTELRILPGGAEISDLRIDWTGGALRLDGGFQDGALRPTRLVIDALDLGAVSRLVGLPEPLQGTVAGRLELAGRLVAPDVEGRLSWQRPRFRGLRADRLDIAVATQGAEWRLVGELVESRREQLHLEARVPRSADARHPATLLADERSRLALRAAEFELAWLSPLFEGRGLDLRGSLDGTLSGVGGTPLPQLEGAMQLRGLALADPGWPTPAAALLAGPVSGRVRLLGRSAVVEDVRIGEGQTEMALQGRFAWAGPRSEDRALDLAIEGIGFAGRARASVDLRGETIAASRVALDGFDAAEIARLAGLRAELGGSVGGELELRGSIAAPEAHARVVWEQPAAGGISADRLQIEAATEEDVVRVRAELRREGADVLAARGALPLERSQSLREWTARMRTWPRDSESGLELQARGFPLDWLPALAPGLPLRTRGNVNGRVVVQGASPLPLVHGDLEITRGTFSLATQKARIGPLDGTLHFAGHRAHFDRLQLAARQGRAELSGEMTWAEMKSPEVALRVDFDEYRFDQLGLVRATLHGTLIARGALQAIDVTGAIDLGDLRIAFPSAQDPILKEIRVLGLPGSGSGTAIREGEIAGVQERSTVDVYIRFPRGTWVRGMGLDAEVVGEVRVVKESGGEVQYLGQLEVEHGRYTLQGKRFELERGVASFDGGERAVPDVDILARRQVSDDVLVRAHLTGPADGPRLELASEPPMDSAEIINYVFLGRSGAGDGSGEGLDARASAASVAGALLVDTVAPELRERLHVDAISMTSDEEGAPAVEIEAQLTPEVYLRLIQSLGASADEAVEVRWRFWKGLTLKSSVSRSGSSAIDLLWEHDYWGLERLGLGGLTPPPPPYREKPRDASPCRIPERCD